MSLADLFGKVQRVDELAELVLLVRLSDRVDLTRVEVLAVLIGEGIED